nr:4332_t:CDS:2 [Entrophospora candida]
MSENPRRTQFNANTGCIEIVDPNGNDMRSVYVVYVLAQNEKELCKKGMRVCGKRP